MTPATFLTQPVRFDRSGYAYESKIHLFVDSPLHNTFVTSLCGRGGRLASAYADNAIERLMYGPGGFFCKDCKRKARAS